MHKGNSKFSVLTYCVITIYHLILSQVSPRLRINNLNRLGMQKCKNLKDFQLKLHRESQKEYRQ